MRIFFPFLLLMSAFLIGSCSTVDTPEPIASPVPTETPIPTPGWTLVWADEFDLPDGSTPDLNTWNYSKGGTGWGNNELQFYTDRPENAFIEDGMLVIQAQAEEYMGRKYTSARINTMVRAEFTYGRIEARAKLPNTQGIWPAIWMMPTIGKYGNWPASGEIDIMEFIGSEPDRVHGTLHYGNPHDYKTGTYVFPDGETADLDFHVFVIEWEPREIRWYVDGQLFHQVGSDEWFTSYKNAPETAPFDQPFYFILNVAVGGNWPGNPDETSVFPQRMLVDYLRVYQR
ncbi:MAG TPA: glycosyl hydrolase family 16 [Chloroflexi bacterium]|nr:glycosyl hydrolase family 16 [Chloroflexota bacterium]